MNIQSEFKVDGKTIFSKTETISNESNLKDFLKIIEQLGEESVQIIHEQIPKKKTKTKKKVNKKKPI